MSYTICQLPTQSLSLQDFYAPDDLVLDIGGGGEGVIGQVLGARTVAIDNRRDELMESPGGGLKIVMDATELGFMDDTFSAVTSFFTLMYMDGDTMRGAVAQAARVLAPGGTLHVWDVTLTCCDAEVFIVPLAIALPERRITPSYGAQFQRPLSVQATTDAAQAAGLAAENIRHYGQIYYAQYRKA